MTAHAWLYISLAHKGSSCWRTYRSNNCYTNTTSHLYPFWQVNLLREFKLLSNAFCVKWVGQRSIRACFPKYRKFNPKSAVVANNLVNVPVGSCGHLESVWTCCTFTIQVSDAQVFDHTSQPVNHSLNDSRGCFWILIFVPLFICFV